VSLLAQKRQPVGLLGASRQAMTRRTFDPERLADGQGLGRFAPRVARDATTSGLRSRNEYAAHLYRKAFARQCLRTISTQFENQYQPPATSTPTEQVRLALARARLTHGVRRGGELSEQQRTIVLQRALCPTPLRI
jgi:hypothetical protein